MSGVITGGTENTGGCYIATIILVISHHYDVTFRGQVALLETQVKHSVAVGKHEFTDRNVAIRRQRLLPSPLFSRNAIRKD